MSAVDWRHKLRQVIYWTINIVLGVIFIDYTSSQTDGHIADWHRFLVLFLIGLGAYAIQRRFQPKDLVEWNSHERAHSDPIVTASRWAGEVKADKATIRAALLSGETAKTAWAVVTRPDGRMLQADREKKGWRLQGAAREQYSDCAIYRMGGEGGPVKPPGWNLLADEPGDFLTLQEAEEVLVAFADRRPLPSSVISRAIQRKS